MSNPTAPVLADILRTSREAEEATRAAARAKADAKRAEEAEHAATGGATRPETPPEELRRALSYQGAVPTALEGGRHDALLSLSMNLARAGFSRDAAWAALLDYGLRCTPPYLDPDMERDKLGAALDKVLAPVVRDVPLARPPTTQPEGSGPSGEAQTWAKKHGEIGDYQHAYRAEPLLKGKLRYVQYRGKWYEYAHGVWIDAHRDRAVTMIGDTLRAVYSTHYSKIGEESENKDNKHYKRIVDANSHRTMSLAAGFLSGFDSMIVRNATDWDAGAWLFNCENGTVNLRERTLKPHDPADLITKQATVQFDPTAAAPQWRAHLDRFLPDADIQRQTQRDLGRALVGQVLQEQLTIWHGAGANGKTTTTRALQAVWGDYAVKAAPDVLRAGKGDEHPTTIADLIGARLVVSEELDEGAGLPEARVADLTGGGHIKARYMRGDYIEVEATFDIVLVTNHPPQVRSSSEGMWRRLKLVPWSFRIPDDERLPQETVLGKLAEDGPGILNWCIDGLHDWLADTAWVAPDVLALTREYRSDQDTLADFLSECCEHPVDGKSGVGDVYEAYVTWCGSARPMAKKTFSQKMKERGITQTRKAGTGARMWAGLRLLDAPDGLL